jgi:hypothetical protein
MLRGIHKTIDDHVGNEVKHLAKIIGASESASPALLAAFAVTVIGYLLKMNLIMLRKEEVCER